MCPQHTWQSPDSVNPMLTISLTPSATPFCEEMQGFWSVSSGGQVTSQSSGLWSAQKMTESRWDSKWRTKPAPASASLILSRSVLCLTSSQVPLVLEGANTNYFSIFKEVMGYFFGVQYPKDFLNPPPYVTVWEDLCELQEFLFRKTCRDILDKSQHLF